MDLSTKNRNRLFAGSVALTLVIGVLFVMFNRAQHVDAGPATAAPTAAPILAEVAVPTSLPSAAAAAATVNHQAAHPETQPAETGADTLPPISPEVAAEIRRLSIQNSDGLVAVKHADGSTSMDLQGHFQSVTAAAIGADGKLVIRHGEEFLKNVQ